MNLELAAPSLIRRNSSANFAQKVFN